MICIVKQIVCKNCRTRLYWICMANIIMRRVAKGLYFNDVIKNSAGRGTRKEWQLIKWGVVAKDDVIYAWDWMKLYWWKISISYPKSKNQGRVSSLDKDFLTSPMIKSGYVSEINYFGDREKCIGRVNLSSLASSPDSNIIYNRKLCDLN